MPKSKIEWLSEARENLDEIIEYIATDDPAAAIHIQDDCVLDAKKFYVDTPKMGLVGRMHGRGWYAKTTDRVEIPRMNVAEWNAKKNRRAAE